MQVDLAVRKTRIARGLSQAELAGRVGIDSAYLSRIEQGQKDIGIKLLTKLSQGLEIHPSEILRQLDLDDLEDDTAVVPLRLVQG